MSNRRESNIEEALSVLWYILATQVYGILRILAIIMGVICTYGAIKYAFLSAFKDEKVE